VGWRPVDNASYYSYTGNAAAAGNSFCTSFSGLTTWSCWARFITAVTVTDEWIFGNGVWSFARQGGTNTLYSHISSGGNSFVNGSAIGADPNNWHHLLGLIDHPNFLHAFYIDGSGFSAGTTLDNGGGANPALFSYDSEIEVAHCAVWNTAFTNAEAIVAKNYDPLTFKPQFLRGYWPLSRGAGQRQCAPSAMPGSGVSDAMYTSVVAPRAFMTDDGPPISYNWPRLEEPQPSVASLVRGAAAFIPSAVVV
jgi:hypothetical protein